MLENYPLLFTVRVGIGYPWLTDRSLDIDVFIISRTLALGLFFLILLNVLGMGSGSVLPQDTYFVSSFPCFRPAR